MLKESLVVLRKYVIQIQISVFQIVLVQIRMDQLTASIQVSGLTRYSCPRASVLAAPFDFFPPIRTTSLLFDCIGAKPERKEITLR